MRRLSTLALAALAVVALARATVQTASAAARPAFELPFPCGEKWQGATYSGHGPYNDYPLDFNQGSGSDDLGKTVVASASGTISVVEEGDGDHVVIINHGGGWTSEYRHMRDRTRTSGTVNRGEKIGTVGQESHPSVSPHLHYEQKLDGVTQRAYFHGVAAPYSYVYNGPTFTSYNCGTGLPTERDGLAVISRGVNLLDVFAKDDDGSVLWKVWNGSIWTDWMDLGGDIIWEPTAVTWGPGRIDVLGLGNDQRLWQRTWTPSTNWQPWRSTGGGQVQWTPTAISRGVGELDVFAVDTAEQVVQRHFDVDTGWTEWVRLGATATAGPGAIALGPDKINLVIRDTDGTLRTRMWWRGFGWYSWAEWGEKLYGMPTLSKRSNLLMDVWSRDDANASLIHGYSVDAGAKYSVPFEGLGGVLTTPPVAVSWAGDRIDVFGRGTNGNLYHKWWNSGAPWSGWQNLGTIP